MIGFGVDEEQAEFICRKLKLRPDINKEYILKRTQKPTPWQPKSSKVATHRKQPTKN